MNFFSQIISIPIHKLLLLLFSRLLCDYNEICEYLPVLYLSWATMGIACILTTMQFQLVEYISTFLYEHFKILTLFFISFPKSNDNLNLFDILSTTILVILTIVFGFVVCESGERVTNQFDMIDDELGRCDWHKLPIKMQKMYLIFRSDTQQSKNITSYGNIVCTRETFKRVRI